MKTSIVLSALGTAALTAAHGIVQNLNIGGDEYSGYLPYNDPYASPVPERIVWAFPTAGNGPVEDVSTSDITCNKAATAAKLTAPAAAGDKVSFYWTEWPESHKGPVMTYLANCGGDCTTVDATTLDYFKIDEAGLNSDGTWASDDLIANNNSWTVTIPSDIVAGSYLIRHELLALHSAGNANGAQFYPMCANLEITGSGSAVPTDTVKFPGGYSATDPGILVNIYGTLTSYTIPGPAVYGSSGSGSGSATTTAAAVATTSAAAVETSSVTAAETTSVAAAETTSAAAVETTSAAAIETTSAAVEVPTTSVAAIKTTSTAAAVVPTTSSAAAVVPTTSAVAAVPTTLVTKTRTSTTAAAATTSAAASTGCSKTSEAYNKCLDAVNECIRNAQSKTGGASNFDACNSQRSACTMC
ncbi:glycosyl hydrolase family 61-domain-containing protein [Morchella snyderi]|nr:glycosyl hydrolase family 61-domain-containing protein [Morchella snyderi]